MCIRDRIKEQLIHYESDSTVDIEQLKNQLVALGYEREMCIRDRCSNEWRSDRWNYHPDA